MYDAQTIQEQINDLLKEKKITIRKMLNECGCDNKFMKEMRNGKMPPIDKLATIAKYLNVSVHYLIGESEIDLRKIIEKIIVNNYISEEDKQNFENIVKDYGKMTSKKRKQFIEYVKFLSLVSEFERELDEFSEHMCEK